MPGIHSKLAPALALTMLCVFAAANEPSVPVAELKPGEKEDAAAKAPAAAQVSGKQAVLKRLEELFKSSSKPVQDAKGREFEKPYMSIVPGKEGRSSIFYRCRFVKSKTIVDALEGVVSNTGVVEDSPDQNMIVINDVSAKAEELKAALLSMDIPLPQILVEAQIIEVYLEQGTERDLQVEYSKYDAAKNLTSTWGYNLDAPVQNPNPTQGAGFDFYPYSSGKLGENMNKLDVALRWLSLSRDAKVLSAPNMVVDLGTTASMVTGEDVPIQSTSVTSGTVTTSINYKRIGVKLNVTPTLINRDVVQLEINPEVSSIVRYEAFSQNGVSVNNPVVGIRNIKTRLTASDGEIIMLGGLYSSEATDATRKIPFFGDIPILGDAFSGKEVKNIDKQLIFFMKIFVLPKPESLLLDPEAGAAEIRRIGDAIHSSGTLFPNRPPVPVLPERKDGSEAKPQN